MGSFAVEPEKHPKDNAGLPDSRTIPVRFDRRSSFSGWEQGSPADNEPSQPSGMFPPGKPGRALPPLNPITRRSRLAPLAVAPYHLPGISVMVATPQHQEARRSLGLALCPIANLLRSWTAWVALLVALASGPSGRAELQFDVFVGLDDRVREGHWFPIAFEILNDGPAFTATVLVGAENSFDSQQRQFAIELPTGTRKRVILPVYPSTGRYSRWEARLLDPDGKLIAERNGLQPKDIAPHIPLIGALPRTFGGLPTLPEIPNRKDEFMPAVARLQSEYLPSNPIALEGLTAWYLNSEKAVDLKADQADALLSWMHNGGHLILAIEQPNDVTALPWLQSILPFVPESITNRVNNGQIEAWVTQGPSVVQLPSTIQREAAIENNVPIRPSRRRNSPAAPGELFDPYSQIEAQDDFRKAEIPVVLGKVTDGRVNLSLGDAPIIITAARGRGTLTVLAFSPEREPFRSWKNRSWFWARTVGIPPELLVETGSVRWGGASIDGLFGAMLDSRQVRKLPIGALLLMLVVYLAVIGPLDQWVLKRMGKQMWTWVTFPFYVVVFSGLIYFIGYRLRAGDLEINEIQVVDQLPRSQGSLLRGRTWLSIYSPGNTRYRVASEQPFATFRAELQQSVQGSGDSGRLTLRQPAKGFDADVFIPVWVSQLYSSDWLDLGPTLLSGELQSPDSEPTLVLENRSDLRFSAMAAAFNGRLYDLGALEPQGRLERPLTAGEGRSLDELIGGLPGIYQTIQQRQRAFGGEGSGQISRSLDGVISASFVERLRGSPFDIGENFASHASFGVNHLVQRGEVVIFGWAPGQALAAPLHRFTPTRSQRDTVVRLSIPGRRPS